MLENDFVCHIANCAMLSHLAELNNRSCIMSPPRGLMLWPVLISLNERQILILLLLL